MGRLNSFDYLSGRRHLGKGSQVQPCRSLQTQPWIVDSKVFLHYNNKENMRWPGDAGDHGRRGLTCPM